MGACISVICVEPDADRPVPERRYEQQALYESRRLGVTAPTERKSNSSDSPTKQQRTPTAHALSPKEATDRQHYAATATSAPLGPLPDALATSQGPAAKSPKLSWTKGELIGTGAFGRVFSGLNNQTGELIAVKQVGISKDEGVTRKLGERVKALEDEVSLLKTLEHENIVQYLGMERTDDAVNILLEYVPGGSIASILGKFGPLKENIIQIYTKQILQGLEYLHQKGIMHRDIKGANILIDNKGTVKLADFGASKRIEDLATIAGANSVRGTPYWMAPEVIKGLGHGRPADIWSLGCTVIEMATGKPPWSNYAAPVSAMFQIASSKDPPPFPSCLSKEAHEFLLLCFNRVPNQRPNATTLLQHAFIAGATARPGAAVPEQQQQSQQATTPRTHVPPQQQQQQGVPPSPVPDTQHSSRLPPLQKPPVSAAKATPSRMSPTKRGPVLAPEASSGLPASSQPLQANRPQLPAQASPRLPPQASPRLPGSIAQVAGRQQQGTAAGAQGAASRPSTGMHTTRPAPGASILSANLPPGPPPIRVHPSPAAQQEQTGYQQQQPQQQPQQQQAAAQQQQQQAMQQHQQHQAVQQQQPTHMPPALHSPLTTGQAKLRESYRPTTNYTSYTTLNYNPIEEPSWMPGYMNMQAAAALQAAAPAASLSSSATGTSATTGTGGLSRTSSRRTTTYDDDDDQHSSSKGRSSPNKPAAAGPMGQDRKPLTPRAGLAAASAGPDALPAAGAAARDTESDVDQPLRSLGYPTPAVTPKAGISRPAGIAAAMLGGIANSKACSTAGLSDMQKSKTEMYIHELELELQQGRKEMRATINMSSWQ